MRLTFLYKLNERCFPFPKRALTRFFERQVKRVLYRLGYDAEPITPLDLRSITDDPIYAAYLARRRTCVIEVPLAHCRGLLGLPYTRQTLQPYVQTVRAYLEGRVSAYENSPLREYYSTFQPKNVWELLGLPGDANLCLLKFPPFAVVRPWEPTSLEEKFRGRIITIRRENRKRGADLSIEHGDGVGPVSIEKGELEFKALARLTDSIRKCGYRRSNRPDGDVRATPLIDNDRGVRYLVWGGKHRIAVLTALGFEYAPLRIRFVGAPRLAEADHWPHVRDGGQRREFR